ncbi:putative GTP pyrophosphokinase [Alkalibaculum bacchi]|jgi:putative GTP pyrophosphokinase|uniref:Putative GTP pyrophosphokinase n=1 Tax=Alkalibaculum bacchi TaxID=645887 RepID=A0A366I9F1_9FIRM|nr:GTP pyrophosphokinase family protein [Alkalibaculum bacchi]RBP64419.1 putative GTP pyrophosphokinase [Alkalibaculum bacchi]
MEIKPVVAMEQLNTIEKDLKRFLLSYRFGLEEVMTKINILRQDFQYIHDYNPIEHVKSRVKSPESILKKINRKDLEISKASIKENIRDIAGIRIVCSFISDIYTISEMIQSQKDLKIVECKDYIKNPKPNGYQSLHLILQIPVFMSDGVEEVYVEIQIRTVGMDFWASLEHKIFYKYNKDIPQKLIDELREAAIITAQLEKRMEILNNEIERIKQINSTDNKNR